MTTSPLAGALFIRNATGIMIAQATAKKEITSR
jgi:hypothetical protein